MWESPDGISWLNHTVGRPLPQLSSDSESQRIWLIRSASKDGGSPSPSGRSGRSSLTIAARARRSRSLALMGVVIAVPFLPYRSQVMPGRTGSGIRRTSDSGHPAGLPTVGRDRSQQQQREIVMYRIRHVCLLAADLAALASALLR